MEVKRRKLQGVLNILSFNRHFYFFGIAILTIIIASYLVLDLPSILFWIMVSTFLYGILMPLIVSAYVYDFSEYYQFKWLKKLNLTDSSEHQLLNINAGFDETSFIIKTIFPKSHLKALDFYNPKHHTEQAIVRARKVSLVYHNTQTINSKHIPINNNSIDIVFLLSAAHEIRTQEEKIEFLKECYRVCKIDGKIIMVEHLRDFPNFLAFSVGFTHFFSKRVWQNAFTQAGFSTSTETKFTPFMSIFIFSKKHIN